MNNISNIAKGVLIGDGALAAFIEIGRNKNCGVGLFDYTTNNGLRKLNTFNNNPRTASYYSTLEKVENTPMSFKRYLGGNLVSAYNVDGLDIGWAYTTDVNNHRFSQGYVSSADFESFQKLLRERYFSNRKDGKPQINNVILEHGDVNSTKPGVGPVNSRLFTEIDFSLPIGKSETELLTFNFKNSGIADNVESIIEFNKYDYTKQYLGRQSLKDVYKVDYNQSKIDHVSYKETKIPSNYNDSRDAFIDSNGAEYGGVTIGNNEDIVAYTKKLFEAKKIGTLVNRSDNNGVNRGRKLREGSPCRVWTPIQQYSKISDLIRPNGGNTYENLQKKLSVSMRPNDGSTRLIKNSVLQENGFVRITPTSTIGKEGDNIKNYMFSIENLAWKDNKHELSEEQKGPNDGRIMWFPPYNLKFSENINVNWNGNSFIGRGEQIYTYTNTERSGTLDFTLLIDHPSILNEWRGRQDMGDDKDYERDLLYFFTGCDTLNMENKPKIFKEENRQTTSGRSNNDSKPAQETIKKLLIIYFPNAFSGQDYEDVDDALLKLYSYEMNNNKTQINIIDKNYSGSSNNNINSLSLNKDKTHVELMTKFKDFKEEDIFTLNDLISVKRGYKKVLNYYKLEEVNAYYEGKYIFSINRVSLEEHCFSNKNGNEFFIIEENSPKSTNGYYQLTLNNIKINNYSNFNFKYDSSSKDIEVYYDNNYITTLKYDIIDGEEVYWDKNDDNMNYLYFSIEEDENEGFDVIPDDIDNWLKYMFEYKVPCENLDDTITIDYVNYDISEELLGEIAFGINQSDYEISKQIIYGGASSHGSETMNKELAKKRANLLVKVLNKIGLHLVDYRYEEDLIDVKGDDINSKEAKLARYGAIVLEYKQKNNSPSNDSSTTSMIGKDANSTEQSTLQEATIVKEIDVKYSFDNEYLYFENIGKNENMVSNILKRVRHFDPAFHSITPEGFNARLTFLHQCTRQGPTSAVNSGQFNTESNNYLKYAGNLSFGRAPYCILRIGDFFNTKIMIESISINYDNSGGLQWDLNPEGAGVQPMLANISMNFKFLGGQDIAGPIEKLQNAISSNYYANASVYDKKAEINKEKNKS